MIYFTSINNIANEVDSQGPRMVPLFEGKTLDWVTYNNHCLRPKRKRLTARVELSPKLWVPQKILASTIFPPVWFLLFNQQRHTRFAFFVFALSLPPVSNQTRHTQLPILNTLKIAKSQILQKWTYTGMKRGRGGIWRHSDSPRCK